MGAEATAVAPEGGHCLRAGGSTTAGVWESLAPGRKEEVTHIYG